MTAPLGPLWEVSDAEGDPPSPLGPEEIREALSRTPKPSVPTDYNVDEADFWRHRFIPPGSVLEFFSPITARGGEDPLPTAAVLVLGVESLATGLWLTVRSLGGSTADEKREVDKYFKGSKKRVHICYPGRDGRCPEQEEEALHLKKFRWFPPGDYDGSFLTAYGRKLVRDARKLEVGAGATPAPEHPPHPRSHGGPESEVEKRLGALRRKATPRVSFAGNVAPPAPVGAHGSRASPRDGTGGVHHPSASLALARCEKEVKKEVEEITDSEKSTERMKKKSKKKFGEVLAKAARMRNAAESRSEDRRSRSGSRTKKKKKKHKKKHNSDSEDSSSGPHSSTSDESLMAPLKKRSKKSPGSVYRMLEETAVEKLSADGVVEEGYEAQGLRGQRPKILTYYQLVLRPHLDVRSRDSTELAMLSRSLDLLRDGRLPELADVLAARLLAVDASTRQGWSTARHLEIFGEDDEGAVPAHVMLSAQKHARQVARAGGKGSWTRSPTWTGEAWQYENRPGPKGKDGKGKGKKGKGKGKAQKGNWNNWNQDRKDAVPSREDKPEAKG